MDLTTSLVNLASEMNSAKTAYEASIKVASKALSIQEQTGQGVLKLIEGGSVNSPTAGASTGSNIDIMA